ncbi:uncharacterized protein TNCV_1774221 [Trichonephila clavipes]|nr:uncharacterized protein TNCV_1774221 [Trichonephila clavipes]
MSSGRSLLQSNLGVQGGIQGDSHSGAQRNINPELRVGSSFRNLNFWIMWRRHPQTTSSLLQLIAKYEERFLNGRIRGSSQEFQDATHSVSNQFPSRNRQENWWDTRVNNRYSDNSRPQRESNLEVKVLVIIGGSIIDAEVVNLIIDLIIKAVDRVVEEGCFQGSEWSKLKNHSGSAGKMEVCGMQKTFLRSEQKHGLKYQRYIGDGDSKTFLSIAEKEPYGDSVPIVKIECGGHV